MTLSPEAAQALVRASQQAQETEILTEREREVLKLMVEGLNNAEIAERLRRYVYSSGGVLEPSAAYRAFRGRDPVVGPMLASRGLVDEREPA